jgi:UDP-glucose 4-epimerase
MRRAAGTNFPVRYGDPRCGDAAVVVADTTRLEATLKWTPVRSDIDAIAADTLHWEQRHHAHGAEAADFAASA